MASGQRACRATPSRLPPAATEKDQHRRGECAARGGRPVAERATRGTSHPKPGERGEPVGVVASARTGDGGQREERGDSGDGAGGGRGRAERYGGSIYDNDRGAVRNSTGSIITDRQRGGPCWSNHAIRDQGLRTRRARHGRTSTHGCRLPTPQGRDRSCSRAGVARSANRPECIAQSLRQYPRRVATASPARRRARGRTSDHVGHPGGTPRTATGELRMVAALLGRTKAPLSGVRRRWA